MKKHSRNNSAEAREFRRSIRRERSASEKVFWEMVRGDRLGFHFRSGLSVGNNVLDFYCSEASLAIELDGEQHDLRLPEDAGRDRWLASRGIEVIRIPTLDLFEETGLVAGKWLKEIVCRCEARSGRSAFDPREGSRRKKRLDSL